MSLGLESGTVLVVPYDSRWPDLFCAEADRLALAVAPLPLDLEHTGSTAVPGLAAKPILDMLGGFPEGARIESYITAIERAGYIYRGEQGIPGRHFFRRGTPRSHHLHLAVVGDPFWRDHIAFRDHLRRDHAAREAYARLKLELAAMYPRDREAYIDGKTAFVEAVLDRARRRYRIGLPQRLSARNRIP